MDAVTDGIVQALSGRREGRSFRCECPVHGGHHFSVTPRQGDKPLVKCLLGASQPEIIAALIERNLWGDSSKVENRSNGHASPAKAKPHQTRQEAHEPMEGPEKLAAEYRYRSPGGAVLAIKRRYEKTDGGKRFAWALPDCEHCKGLSEHGLSLTDMPLYGLEHLGKAAEQGFIVLCEGEKATQACWRANLIAVCPASGAGQTEFGEALQALAGMDVVLWPDNDDVGRQFMRAIKEKLQGVATSVRTVTPQGLPPKGDAHEWFASGKTKQDFTGLLDQIQDKPWVEATADGYLVTIPEMDGFVRFDFAGISYRGRNHEAEASVWLDAPGHSNEPFHGRLNLMSLSNRDIFRRQLEDSLPMGKGVWGRLLNKAITLAHKAHQDTDPSIPLSQVSTVIETRYLVKPWVVMDGPSVLFGQGGASKSFLALMLALSVSLGAPFLGVEPEIKGGVLFLDYEASAERIKARAQMLQNGFGIGDMIPAIYYWPSMGVPLPELVPALLRKIKHERIVFIIVDSAIPACGGAPKEPEVAGTYFNALRKLDVPSLTISHVVKDEEGDKYPFGSIAWHTLARLTWNVKLQQEEGDNILHVGLFNRKGNDDKKIPSFGLKLEFEDAPGGSRGLTIQREDILANFGSSLGAKAQILGALNHPLCSVCLSEETGISKDSVRVRLNELKGRGKVVPLADKCRAHNASLWGLRERGAR